MVAKKGSNTQGKGKDGTQVNLSSFLASSPKNDGAPFYRRVVSIRILYVTAPSKTPPHALKEQQLGLEF